MISHSTDLKQFLKNRGDLCAVDTEADSLHRYSESLCLIQFSDGNDHVLIDPLAIDDMSALSEYLTKAT